MSEQSMWTREKSKDNHLWHSSTSTSFQFARFDINKRCIECTTLLFSVHFASSNGYFLFLFCFFVFAAFICWLISCCILLTHTLRLLYWPAWTESLTNMAVCYRYTHIGIWLIITFYFVFNTSAFPIEKINQWFGAKWMVFLSN